MFKITFLFIVLAVSVGFSGLIEAQSAVEQRRLELQQQLSGIEQEIDAQRKILEGRQRESVSLERDIDILTAKIKKSKLNIKALDIAIASLSNDIGEKSKTVEVLTEKLEKEKSSLSSILRQTYVTESYPLQFLMLDNRSLSDFFSDVDSFVGLRKALQASFDEIETDRTKTETEKNTLQEKKNEQEELRALQAIEQKRIQKQEAEKKEILKISKGVEGVYQSLIKDQEKNAAKIRTELFTLRGSSSIPFEKALELAMNASAKTGVRPAMILGIIAEESNLGENVGTGSWRVDMKAPRDTEPFLDITRRLGLDPDKMPVSKKPWYGWGGAMGPAQFIPSTWVLYEDRIGRATGHVPPNPWDPGDAFMATAILMADNGADKQTYATERLAALRYLAGWTNATKKAYAFYGDDVMELATKYQKQIDILNRSN